MIAFHSNLPAVLRQLTDLRDRRIPAALARAAEANRWREGAQRIAKSTLLGLAQPWQAVAVDQFVATITSRPLHLAGNMAGFALGISIPEEPAFGRADDAAVSVLLGQIPDQDALLDAVTKWVEAPYLGHDQAESGKDLDARDSGKTADEIARDITFLLTYPAGKSTPNRDAARAALWPPGLRSGRTCAPGCSPASAWWTKPPPGAGSPKCWTPGGSGSANSSRWPSRRS